jgi:opine dehydrogenase
MSKLGQQIGVATPGIDAIISVASIVMARDYRAEALRTPESLGIADRSAEELMTL